jgi:hypothetical protein
MLAFTVADLWAEWPVQDAAVDLVISAQEVGSRWRIPARIIWPSLATASGCCDSSNMLPDAHMGRLDDPREIVERLRAITPLVIPNRTSYLRNSENRELLLSGLRLAAGEGS